MPIREIQNPKSACRASPRFRARFPSLRHSDFGFVSYFVLCISYFRGSVYCLLLASLLLAVPTRLHAQCTGDSCRLGAPPSMGVVRVVNAQGSSRWYGSGTLVDADDQGGVVLTCGHLFPRGAGSVAVIFADGRQAGARLLGLDRVWDLAALEIPRPEIRPVPIAADSPQPGEPLQSCGYGADGRYWCNQGRALGYVRIAGAASYETLELSGSAREGDSGGPVFNQRGELVAVLWGTDGRIVGGTYCGRIRQFLARILSLRRPSPRPQPSPEGTLPSAPGLPAPPAATPAPPASTQPARG